MVALTVASEAQKIHHLPHSGPLYAIFGMRWSQEGLDFGNFWFRPESASPLRPPSNLGHLRLRRRLSDRTTPYNGPQIPAALMPGDTDPPEVVHLLVNPKLTVTLAQFAQALPDGTVNIMGGGVTLVASKVPAAIWVAGHAQFGWGAIGAPAQAAHRTPR
ncbi:MAG TPA: hypothetical protein VKR21_16025 [Solirubrobacteraceae bacterium]|nr:hypothetical protein [Solirubrobacteraceae bacterium]